MFTMTDLKNKLGTKYRDIRGTLPVAKTEWSKTTPSKRKGVCFHHTACDASCKWSSIAKYHISRFNKGGISYTAGVDADGTLNLFWDLNTVTYSQGYVQRAGDENVEFIGIAFGGFFKSKDYPEGGEPTSEQLDTASKIIELTKQSGGEILGHYSVGKPACPGDTLRSLIESARKGAETLASVPSAKATALIAGLNTSAGLQKALNALGYKAGSEDGIFGPKTRLAVEKFQKNYGLAVDGVPGPKTKATLAAALQKL